MKELRRAGYYRKVTIGKRTVKDGECCAIWNISGKQTLVEGPLRRWIFFSRVAFLDHLFADQNQYIVLEKVDGTVEHRRGPTGLFANPLTLKKAHVENAIRLESFENVLVYENKKSTTVETPSASSSRGENVITTRLITGPSLVFLLPSESLHQFNWFTDGTADDKVTDRLSTVPERLLVNVSNVHTSDNALVTINLAVTIQVNNLQKIVSHTDTPITELRLAASADVVVIAGENTFEELVDHSHKLSQLGQYSNLTSRAAQIGITICKIQYTGYNTSSTLKAMHEKSLDSRNAQKLLHAEQEQELQLKELTLNRKLQLLAKEHESEQQSEMHKLGMEKRKLDQELALQRAALERERAQIQADYANKSAFVKELASRGVDVTEYLCSQISPVDKVIRVERGDLNLSLLAK